MQLRLWLLLVVLAPVGVAAQRQPFHASIGNSVVALTGPWAFHPGDNMAWAQPDFDDSLWTPTDLTPTAGTNDPLSGAQGYVPGWTARGFPDLSGYAWYRMRVMVDNNSASAEQGNLAMQLPEDVDDAYQVYVNGRLIGQFGHFSASGVSWINAQPRSFRLPPEIRGGVITIAIRMWMDASSPLTSPDAGGLHGAPMLGQAPAIAAMERLDWYDVDRGETGNFIVCPLAFFAALLGLSLFLLDRRETAYLWLSLAAAANLAYAALVLVGYYATYSMTTENIVLDVVLRPLSFLLWAVFWSHWFRLEESKRIIRIASVLFVLVAVSTATLRPPLFGHLIPLRASSWLFPVTLILKLALGAVIVWVVYRGIRKHRGEGWLALPAVIPMFGYLYQNELLIFHIPTVVYIWSVVLTVGNIALLLTLAAISILMLRRFVGGLHEREQMRQELEQARQVQQVLIPEALPTVPGFDIQSEYHPAQQVGGDFFQIIPLEGGRVLGVIGDVSGKGTPAAMTVALLVGSVRTVARTTNSPSRILEEMNLRMIGRSRNGFTTCLVVRVDADGTLTFANAGHLSPYCEGKEIPVVSGLPLGLNADSTYPEIAYRLAPGERLTLLTDGVVEARSRTGELFGFERTATLVAQNLPATGIAQTAKAFGQEDDITILTLTRLPVNEPLPTAAHVHA